MKLLLASQRKKLIANYIANRAHISAGTKTIDHQPVVKMFTPWGGNTWLFTELDPVDGTLFGLCDLGRGSPEIGKIALADLMLWRGPAGLAVERDIYFTPTMTLTEYASQAYSNGGIAA
jgi:hypothetical protein